MQTSNDSMNGTWAYAYGPLNRLVEACSPDCTAPVEALDLVYDRFGNRWQQNVAAGSAPGPQLSFDANNHIVGASYDSAGDLLSDGTGATYTYNAAGKIACVNATGANCQGASASYVYDAFGHRVETIVGGAATYYVHDLDGRLVNAFTSSVDERAEVFAGGRHLATYVDGTKYFDYSDWLSTERMRATLGGLEQNACTSLPYGDNLACSGASDPSPLHFTGAMHDAETGLGHFPARNYNSRWATWQRPDPLGWLAWQSSDPTRFTAYLANPQNLDLYDYTADNPVTLTDPTGLYVCNKCQDGSKKKDEIQKPSSDQPSWDKTKPLPDSPSKLGPDWKRNPAYKNPHGEEFINDKTGEKLEWNKGRPGPWGPKSDRGRDGWHFTPPGGVRGKQVDPGTVLRTAVRVGVWGTVVALTIKAAQVAVEVCVAGACY